LFHLKIEPLCQIHVFQVNLTVLFPRLMFWIIFKIHPELYPIQRSIWTGIGPGLKNAEVTKMREKADELFAIMKNKRNCPVEIKDEMKFLIKSFMDYDHGKTEPHHLLDKIAAFGSLSDWEATNVKQGTPLAKRRTKEGDGMMLKMKHPELLLRSNNIVSHLLTIINPDTPESKAPPKGFNSILIFCYIGFEPPAGLSDYRQAGKTNRGLFVKSFSGFEPEINAPHFAWYIARYESRKGMLGEPSEPLKVPIIILSP
jgi:hypothetical protein